MLRTSGASYCTRNRRGGQNFAGGADSTQILPARESTPRTYRARRASRRAQNDELIYV